MSGGFVTVLGDGAGGGGAGENWAATLAIGNESGGTDAVISDGDALRGEPGLPLDIRTVIAPGPIASTATLRITAAGLAAGDDGAAIEITGGAGLNAGGGGDVSVIGGAGGDEQGGALNLFGGAVDPVGGGVFVGGPVNIGGGLDQTATIRNRINLLSVVSMFRVGTPLTQATRGQYWVSDGSGGLVLGGYYYKRGDGTIVQLDVVAVPETRTLTAGAGLTGGGDLSADRTFDVGANADGSITVNPNDIQVGVLATDAQHGLRGGGTQHALATPVVAGFMSPADKTKLDALALTRTAFFKFTGNSGTDVGDYRIVSVGANASISITFSFPETFTTLVKLVLVFWPTSTFVAQDIDLTSDYAAPGQLFNNHQGSDLGSTYSATADTITEIDVSGLFASAAANDYAGLMAKSNAIGTGLNYVGLRMVWT